MRLIFVNLFRAVQKDRSYLYTYYFKELIKPKSENFLVLSMFIYEVSNYYLQKKRQDILLNYNNIRYMEKNLKEKGIPVD